MARKKKQNNMDQRTKIILGVVIVFVVILAFAYMNLHQKSKKLEKEQQQVEAQIKKEEEKKDELKKKKEYIKTKEFIEKTFSDKTEISFKKDLREDIRNSNVLKFNIMEIDRPDLIDKVRVDLELVKNIEVTSSWKDNLEVMSEGSHKGNAVEYLCELLDIDREHIIAFGDNYNDLSMIEFAGTGVAMGNAEDDVKKIANHITDSNGNDGVAKAIYDLVLQKVVSE